jgi:acyl-CoA synthetase (AMP-forming)/AMP-acid ligase II
LQTEFGQISEFDKYLFSRQYGLDANCTSDYIEGLQVGGKGSKWAVLVNRVFNNFTERSSRPALITSAEIVTFEEYRDLALKLASTLRNAGTAKGSHVAILLPEGIDYCVAYGAIWLLGAVAVPLNTGMKAETAAGVLLHADAEFLILDNLYPASPEHFRRNVPSLRWIASTESGLDGADESLEQIYGSPAGDFEPPQVEETDTCAIFYTSGTTGEPKGIVWNYRHLDGPTMIMEHFLDMPGDDIQICAAPLGHAGGLSYLLGCLKWGLPTVIMPRFIPGAFLRNIEQHRVTMCYLVPAMFVALARAPEFEKADLSSLRWISTFGAMADLGALEKLQEKCPDLIILNGWGMMEAAPPNSLPHLDREEIDLRGVGFVPPWIEVRVVTDTGREVAQGETGEVVLRGWVVMDGYYKDPELTAETIRDGWLHSGDLGRLDERGYLYIVGRKKDVIIVGGLNVHSSEVEGVLTQHPAVQQAAVTGAADELRGEVVKAHIVLVPGAVADERELTEFCRSRLESYKIPKVFEFPAQLPRTSTGKVAKWQLR